MPARTTRSGREVKHQSTKQSKLDALEILARQRRGEKVDNLIKEDEPLFEDVDAEEYESTRKGGFVVDADSDDGDSDLSFVDDDYDEEETAPKKKRSSKRRGHLEPDPGQKSMKSFLGAGSISRAKSNYHAPSVPSTSKQPELNSDDILSQMLFDVPKNQSSAVKPIRVPRVSEPAKVKASYEPTSVKRPRMESNDVANDFGINQPTVIDQQQDILFDDSMPVPDDIPHSTSKNITKANYDQYNIEDIVQNDQNGQSDQDVGVKAVPLNDDLKSNLEFCETDGKLFTRFYWYDCCEDQNKHPGVVYFFGRVYTTTAKRYVSCCTIVKNVTKTCYLLIDNASSYNDVVSEFTHIIAKKFKIKNFTVEEVTKKYAFSSDSSVPSMANYVKVDYPANQATLPADLVGETFSKVLNTSQSQMEKLILELKLRGPCWLKLVDPVAPGSQITWTRIELIVESPSNINFDDNAEASKPPYFSICSLSLRTYKNPSTQHNEIIAVSVMVNTSFNLDECLKKTNKASGHFVIMTKPISGHKELRLPYDFQAAMKKYTRTKFELVDTERDLLLSFMDKFNNLDPDIVVGHDLLNFDYETLVMRMKMTKVGIWSKLGRFRRSELPSTKAAFRYMFSGRVLCDVRISAMELIKARSYDLTELTSQVLKKGRVELSHQNIVEAFKSSSSLVKLVDLTWEDVDNIFSILVELNIIPLALKITNITGNILSRTLAAGRSERNEYLLLHAFHEDNFICPEKQRGDMNQMRRKAAYAGGLVLEPKAGFYDTCILLMDFNSLYPSIIQEFNICFSTVKVPEQQGSDEELLARLPDPDSSTGILPAQLKTLVDRRKSVKRLIESSASEDQKSILDIEQKALKLTANSMYGCLGFEQSRFYAKHLASLVTFKGREILMNTKAIVEKLGHEVVYGDTDSLMIDTKVIDLDEVMLKGLSIKESVNKTFRLLEIDIDGVYRPLLLLKKKNYAGVSIKKLPTGETVKSTETKGLDTVRRDRAVIAKEAGELVLDMILSNDKDINSTVEDIHNYLRQLGDQVRSGILPQEKFLISKQLNRNPEEYRNTKGVGHVILALRHNSDSKKTKKLKAGDTVEYVICLDGTKESANQRAYTLEELGQNSSTHQLDVEYYLCQQIHPVITRICDKLPITNAYTLAEILGIEKSGLLHLKRDDSDAIKKDQLISKGENRYNLCKPIIITCPNCNLPDEITTRVRKNKDKKEELSLTRCPQCSSRYSLFTKEIVVQVISLIRRLNFDLRNAPYVCQNVDCNHETRNIFCQFDDDLNPKCDLCYGGIMIPSMDDRKMDLQLGYYRYLFDTSRQEVESSDDVKHLYRACYDEFNYQLKCSFINNIDTFSVFKMVCSGRQ